MAVVGGAKFFWLLAPHHAVFCVHVYNPRPIDAYRHSANLFVSSGDVGLILMIVSPKEDLLQSMNETGRDD